MSVAKARAGAPSLSIVVPAYDEERRLELGLRAILDWLDAAGREGEVLVVDDGSTDGTAGILADAARADGRIRALTHPANRGKGAAVRTGALAASGDLVLFTDVDQSTPMACLADLEAAIAGGVDVAIASREVAGARRVVPQPFHRRAMGFVFMALRSALVLPGFIDTQCGFKLFTRDAAREVFGRSRIDGWCFDVEVLAIALRRGCRVREVPVSWTDDPASKVSPLLDSLGMLRDLWLIRRRIRRGDYDPPPTRPG